MGTSSLNMIEISGLDPGWYNVSAIYVITGNTPATQFVSLELAKRPNPAAVADVIIAWYQKEFTTINPEIDGTLSGVVQIAAGESISFFGNVNTGTASIAKDYTYINYTRFA
jgi:hypothetical protein